MRKEEILARARAQLKILRVPARSKCEVVLLSERALFVACHWLSGRQWLCSATEEYGCPACHGQVPRCVGFGIVRLVANLHVDVRLLEFSPGSHARLNMLAEMEGWPVGCGLHVGVSRARPRSGLRMEPLGFASGHDGLSESRLLDAIAVLFGLPLTVEGEQSEDWARRVQPLAASLLGRAIAMQGGEVGVSTRNAS